VLAIVRLFKFFWFLTFPVYFVTLFICYFQWPDHVSVHVDNLGDSKFVLEKSSLFYAITAFMIAYNMIIYILVSSIAKLPTSALPIPQKEFWTSTKENSTYVQSLISNWIYTVGAILNIIFVLWIVMITYANLEQFDMRKPMNYFSFIMPLFYVLMVAMILVAIGRFNYKKIIFNN
jgi:hypothetical protein